MQTARLLSDPAAPPADADPAAVQMIVSQALDHHMGGRLDRAHDLYRQALSHRPDDSICLHHLGLIAHSRGDNEAAAELIGAAVRARPDYAEAYSNLGAVLRACKRLDAAIAALQRAIALAPEMAQAHSNLGSVFEDHGRNDAALVAYRQAGMLNARFVDAFVNAANLLRKLDRNEEALTVCHEIIEHRPDAAAAHVALGAVLVALHRTSEASAAYHHALRLQPDLFAAYVGLGNLLLHGDDPTAAITVYRKAIDVNPGNIQARFNLGAAYECTGQMADALEWYKSAVGRDADFVAARCQIHHVRRHICDWDGIEADETDLLARLAVETKPVSPFSVVSLNADAALQLRVARNWTRRFENIVSPYIHTPAHATARDGRRLRIGYLSADFCSHATANLMAELFERHDRVRFEIFAYSYGPNDGSEMRARLESGFDHFIDIRGLNDVDAAAQIHDDAIDVLVELKGFTRDARLEIVALRPAPIQVSFIGFPGTLGCAFMDYVLADPFVLPMSEQPFYDERIVHLPDSYQPNDSHRLISSSVPSRAACGLPEGGFVFCCFNNNYKITPPVFDVWMRLLLATPNSVMWLFDANGVVKDNLRAAARARGVDPARLVFAPRINKADHLARQRLADLFLDTLPYNAHTTTSDALWSGLPVLTCAGTTFAGRVAGSLLHAVDLPELVTHSLDAYEALALDLARAPERLAGIRRKLAVTRLTARLFDTPRFARHIEAAFDRMWALYAAGEMPKAFAVDAIDAVAEATVVASNRQEAVAFPVPALLPVSAPKHVRLPYPACPLCDCPETEPALGANVTDHRLYPLGVAPDVLWHACPSCTHVFTEGYFDDAARAAFDAMPAPGAGLADDLERNRPAAMQRVERVGRHVGGGNWLDVGFGNGALLFAAEEWGFLPYGLDPREAAADALRALGFPANAGSLQDLAADPHYAVISFSDGLHRYPFPRTALRAAHARLQTGGALVMTMPNADTALWRVMHVSGANPYWAALDHYHAFGRKRLEALLRAEGFRPVGYAVDETYRSGMEVVALKV